MVHLKAIYTTLIRDQKKETALFFTAALLLTALQAPLPYLSGYLVDFVIPKNRHDLLMICTALMAILYALFLVVDFINDRYRLQVRERLLISLSEKAMTGILKMPRQRRLALQSGDLTSRLTRDAAELHYIMPYGWSELAHKILLCISILAVLFFLNWKLSCILLILMPAGIFIYLRYEKSLWITSQRESESSADKLSAIQETIEADAEVRAYQAEGFFSEHSGDRIKQYEKRRFDRELLDTKIGVIAIGVPLLATTLIWSLGGWMVMSEEITLGFIITYTSSLAILVPALIYIIEFGSGVPNEIFALSRLQELIISDESTLQESGNLVNHAVEKAALLETTNLAFSYTDKSPLLSSLSVQFEPGCIHLINGANGTGKSTLLQLLGGLHTPQSGTVKVNNIDITTLANRTDWVTYVPQKIRLISSTVRENLGLGESFSDEAMLDALKVVGLHDWVSRLDNGIDQQLGNSNNELSGGQIQKIGLARALLRKTPILLLDEPTNNLDSSAVNELLSLLEQHKSHRIIIIISHDERVANIADRVVHLENTNQTAGTRVDIRTQSKRMGA